ncbi:MAG: hypothetical protein MHMPM18_002868, partial [Marteilia pararefringens]
DKNTLTKYSYDDLNKHRQKSKVKAIKKEEVLSALKENDSLQVLIGTLSGSESIGKISGLIPFEESEEPINSINSRVIERVNEIATHTLVEILPDSIINDNSIVKDFAMNLAYPTNGYIFQLESINDIGRNEISNLLTLKLPENAVKFNAEKSGIQIIELAENLVLEGNKNIYILLKNENLDAILPILPSDFGIRDQYEYSREEMLITKFNVMEAIVHPDDQVNIIEDGAKSFQFTDIFFTYLNLIGLFGNDNTRFLTDKGLILAIGSQPMIGDAFGVVVRNTVTILADDRLQPIQSNILKRYIRHNSYLTDPTGYPKKRIESEQQKPTEVKI